MKSLLCFVLLLVAPTCLAEKFVPLGHIDLKIEIGNKEGELPRSEFFEVTVIAQRESADAELECGLRIDAPNFKVVWHDEAGTPKGVYPYSLGREDILALHTALAAAAKEEPYTTEVKRWGATIAYEAFPKGKTWKVRVHSGKSGIELSKTDVAQLLNLVQEAILAKRWYEALLTSDKPIEANERMKPPRSDIWYLSAELGSVTEGDFMYEAALNSWGQKAHHRLSMPNHEISGDKARKVMHKVVDAAEAAKIKDGYSFIGRHGDLRYEITADPHGETAELKVHPDFGRSDLYKINADYDMRAAKKIKALIKQTEIADAWYAKHENLIVANPEDRIRFNR